MGKRELVALLSLSSCGYMVVVWLFLAVPWVCLQLVIVVFPDHTHYFLDLKVSFTKHNSYRSPANKCHCLFHLIQD